MRTFAVGVLASGPCVGSGFLAFMKADLDGIEIVLAGIRNTGNIGSAARAMKNMGITRLTLVNPAAYETAEVYNLGWGAEDVIRSARVCESIEEAVSRCGFVVGTTRRKGKRRRPVVGLREALPRIAAATRRNRVAILFGREDRGLTNAEFARCQLAVSIESSSLMPSLNIAQAVMIVCYELFMFEKETPAEMRAELATASELTGLYGRLERTLTLIGYGERGNRKVRENVLSALKRIFNRSGLARHELDAIHGLCQQIERFAGSEKGRGTSEIEASPHRTRHPPLDTRHSS